MIQSDIVENGNCFKVTKCIAMKCNKQQIAKNNYALPIGMHLLKSYCHVQSEICHKDKKIHYFKSSSSMTQSQTLTILTNKLHNILQLSF